MGLINNFTKLIKNPLKTSLNEVLISTSEINKLNLIGLSSIWYKTIPSLKQVIFIDQAKVYISSYLRTADPQEWINHDYYSLKETLKLTDFNMKIEDIYRKILPKK